MKTRDLVIMLFQQNEETRNSDLLLTWVYLKKFCGLDMPPLSWGQIQRLEGRLESIRRIRAKIQNVERIYPPTRPEVMKKRRQKEADYQEFFGRGKK